MIRALWQGGLVHTQKRIDSDQPARILNRYILLYIKFLHVQEIFYIMRQSLEWE